MEDLTRCIAVAGVALATGLLALATPPWAAVAAKGLPESAEIQAVGSAMEQIARRSSGVDCASYEAQYQVRADC